MEWIPQSVADWMAFGAIVGTAAVVGGAVLWAILEVWYRVRRK